MKKNEIMVIDEGIPGGDHTAIVIAKKEKGVIKIKKIIQEPVGVKDLMNIFYQVNPTLNWANKTYRSSAVFMINKFGLDQSKLMAEAAVSVLGVPYAPQITNPWELKEKLLKLKLYMQSNFEANKPKEIKQL